MKRKKTRTSPKRATARARARGAARKAAPARSDSRRAIPQVERLLAAVERDGSGGDLPRRALVLAARQVLEETRRTLGGARGRNSASASTQPSDEAALAHLVVARARHWTGEGEPRVINATGVPLHTNLGRAPLSESAVRALERVGRGYLALEYDLERGRRSRRGASAEARVRALTGAESALVVNNNAAAVLLVLSALASGKRVLVSRGELIEIGGSYRLPEVFEKSGARLLEVGTTNRTHLRDYERALSRARLEVKRGAPPIALVLRVHPSNYRTLGFTARPALPELAALCRTWRVPLVEDLGSGALIDLTPWGLTGEPTVQEVLRGGADLVTFSGDKLLGGPQAGILAGRARLVDACRKDPLARAVRVEKLTLGALEATLAHYFDPEGALREVPTLRMLTASLDQLRERAEELAARLSSVPGLEVELRRTVGEAGGGSLPTLELPGWGVTLRAEGSSAAALDARLRAGEPAVVARIQGGRVLLDTRTLLDEPLDEIAAAVAHAAATLPRPREPAAASEGGKR